MRQANLKSARAVPDVPPTIRERLETRSLTWWPEVGIGYYPVSAFVYDQAYFDKYVGYASTILGRGLNHLRCNMVVRHWDGPVCDIGIGCGSFIAARRQREEETTGYDENPVAVKWLRDAMCWQDIYFAPAFAVTMWDALEHVENPCALLAQVRRWVFLSMPIFQSAEHVLASKHYRRDEHFWYFTARGLIAFMAEEGFELREQNWAESELGREDIGSFAFERVND